MIDIGVATWDSLSSYAFRLLPFGPPKQSSCASGPKTLMFKSLPRPERTVRAYCLVSNSGWCLVSERLRQGGTNASMVTRGPTEAGGKRVTKSFCEGSRPLAILPDMRRWIFLVLMVTVRSEPLANDRFTMVTLQGLIRVYAMDTAVGSVTFVGSRCLWSHPLRCTCIGTASVVARPVESLCGGGVRELKYYAVIVLSAGLCSPVEVTCGVTNHARTGVGSIGPSCETVEYRLISVWIEFVDRTHARCSAGSSGA
jgi:hypothetical protein